MSQLNFGKNYLDEQKQVVEALKNKIIQKDKQIKAYEEVLTAFETVMDLTRFEIQERDMTIQAQEEVNELSRKELMDKEGFDCYILVENKENTETLEIS